MNREVICIYIAPHELCSVFNIYSNQNPGDSCCDIKLQNILHMFFFLFFFYQRYIQHMYVIVEIDRVTEETWDVPTWIRVPLTVYTCILREAVGVFELVYGESRRVVVRASRDTQLPTILAKSPAKSLLLITRQREHHGVGHIIIHNDVIHFPRTPRQRFPPPHFPCALASPFSLSLISSPYTWWHLLSLSPSLFCLASPFVTSCKCIFHPPSMVPCSFRRILLARQEFRNRINMQIFTCQGVENCRTSRCAVHTWEMRFRECCVLNLIVIYI